MFKKLNTFNEVDEFFKKFINQKWEISFGLGYYSNFYVYPEKPFLSIFNHLSVRYSTYTFSIWEENNQTFRKTFISALKFAPINNLNAYNPSFYINGLMRYQNFSKINQSETLKDGKSAKLVFKICKAIFSTEFISTNHLSESKIESEIKKKNFENFELNDKNASPFYRLEEIKSDFRIILWVCPRDYDIKISFTRLHSYGIANPLTSFYERYFGSGNFEFYDSIHDLNFLEKQGSPRNPLAQNNIQVFKVSFDCFDIEGETTKLWNKSGKSQIKFLKQLLAYLFIVTGKDVFGKALLSKSKEICFLPLGDLIPTLDKNTKLTNAEGNRFFSNPEYDIAIYFGSETHYDNEEKPFQISFISASVFPFDNIQKEEVGWALHPFIYECEK